MDGAERNRTAKLHPRGNLLFPAALLFLVIGIIAGSRQAESRQDNREVRAFERVLQKKERLLMEEFARLEQLFDSVTPTEVLNQRSTRYQEMANREGISIFYFEGGRLTYWSDHSIPVASAWRPRYNQSFIRLLNADYVSVLHQMEGRRLFGLIEIRTHFPTQNEFLVNGFHKDFTLDPGVTVEFLEDEGTRPVFNVDGGYLFSLDFRGAHGKRDDPGPLSRAGMVLSVLLFFGGLFSLVGSSSGRRRWTWILVVTVLIPLVAFLLLQFGVPVVCRHTLLFRPDLFAGRFFPSLGHLLVETLAVIGVVGLHYMYGEIPDRIRDRLPKRTLAILLFILGTLMFLMIEQLTRTLVLDSWISFEAYRVTSLSVYTVVGMTILAAWFMILGMVLDRAITCLGVHPVNILVIGGGSISAVMLAAYLLPGDRATWTGWIALLLLLGAQYYLRFRVQERVRFSRFIFLLLFISVFLVIRLQHYNGIKVERQKEVELVKLSSEHDPVAEMLCSELSMALRGDSILYRLIVPGNIDIDDIDRVVNRLRRNYFSGYWTKYDLQVSVCGPGDDLYLEPPDDEWQHCYTFFDDLISTEGIAINGSDFHFLDNLNGRISYLAAIPFRGDGMEYRLFIELDSRILSEELGYPELLLDKQYDGFPSSRFSYARYNRDELISREGEFPYRRSARFYAGKGEGDTFERVTREKYDHTVYHVDDLNTIIVGSPSVTLMDDLISFTYVFAINFLLLALLYLFFSLHLHGQRFNWSFKHRIQYSLAGILFLTFALVCSGTIFFIVQQYRDKNNDNMRNTMRSVYIELVHKVEYEEDLRNWFSESYYDLDELLRKFSNVFNSDINLYDPRGELLATSRSEIFERQLLSTRMNRLVFENLDDGRAAEFIHDEHIGELEYTSAYVPLLNSKNKLLAYLNLPYFTQSEVLTRDVTNMVVAVVNIYLILLLLILGASVFLADRITQPLRMLQNRIAQVSLSEKNEMIIYDRSDEIRGLVEEYNFMVRELERSAELLAQGERESAWREMAKQIAHEIKNPLTPMKLNVQHLQRAILEGKDEPGMIDRIAATLIEQIDSLSAIANEFSDFAKMPKPKNERINLVTKLKNLLQLFETSERTEITLDLGAHKGVYVFADKEQLTRLFINLVKNGIQSIPEGRKGIIHIGLQVEDEKMALVTIKDNGKGIPESIRDRLFQPNFTTKSAGMGMGLAIASNIVRSLDGRIWYETALDKGTTFFIEFPLVVDKSGGIS